MAEAPLVSVITPVLNGANYLDACLASVRDQTYRNWEHVVVDNASDDDTRAIVRKQAERDPRIRLVACRDRLPMIPNWNRAMRELPPSARYCKVIHHDDLLMPECLERMVALAELHPNIGLVGADIGRGDGIEKLGIPTGRTVIPGREVVLAYLRHVAKLGGYWVFGSPSSTMLRADLVRPHEHFYNQANQFQPDTEACCEVLRHADFGFVRQVLTVTRMHAEQQTTRAIAMASSLIEELGMLIRFGRDFLDEDEYERFVRAAVRNHDRFLAGALLQQRPRGFWGYHLGRRRVLGQALIPAAFARAVAAEAVDLITHPRQTLHRIRRRLVGGRADGDVVVPGGAGGS